jgi:uncharacterized membrane protein
MDKNTLKGYFFIIVGILANSNVYIFSKAALQEIHITQFGFYWFGTGLIWNSVYALITCQKAGLRQLRRRQYMILISIGLLEIISTTMFFTAINVMDNPSVVSFIGNTGPFYVVFFGIVMLKERFSKWEATGMILTLIGALIISYSGHMDMSGIFVKGAHFALLSALFGSVTTIITKTNIKNIPPPLLVWNRNAFLFLFALAMLLASGYSFKIPGSALTNTLIGSILGPFLTVFGSYNALKYVEASRVSVLGSSKALVVMIFAYIYFGSLPMEHQIYGGLISVLGVFLISFGRSRIFKQRPDSSDKIIYKPDNL